MSNSVKIIEDEKGAGAAVTRVRQLFQDIEIKEKVITLIEGPDDEFCYKHLLATSKVYFHRINIRFHEKIVGDLIAKYPTKLISIRDADFCRANNNVPTRANMFHTDEHDLETMMLSSGDLVDLTADYPGLVEAIDKRALCGILLDYSYMQWYNYNGHKNLAFKELNTVNLYENGKLANPNGLFAEVCACSSMHTATFAEYELFKQSHPVNDNLLLCITNGHDLMDCIYSEMHKVKRGNLPKAKVLKSFYKNYTISMFQQTLLYAQLSDWARLNGQSLLVAA